MNDQRRKRRSPHLEPARLTTSLAATLTQQGCSPAEVERAQTLWQEFLANTNADKLSGSVASWCAALHYLVAPVSGRKLTQKDVGARYHTAASTLSNRITLLKASTDQAVLATSFPTPPPQQRKRRADKTAEKVFAAARQHARPTAPPDLDDAGWIAVFRETHRLLSHLYTDKTHIEILLYLSHVEMNLALAGYSVAREFIQAQFSRLFSRLGLQPAKGRDPQKFVSLQDVSGTREPFVLLKLGYENG